MGHGWLSLDWVLFCPDNISSAARAVIEEYVRDHIIPHEPATTLPSHSHIGNGMRASAVFMDEAAVAGLTPEQMDQLARYGDRPGVAIPIRHSNMVQHVNADPDVSLQGDEEALTMYERFVLGRFPDEPKAESTKLFPEMGREPVVKEILTEVKQLTKKQQVEKVTQLVEAIK